MRASFRWVWTVAASVSFGAFVGCSKETAVEAPTDSRDGSTPDAAHAADAAGETDAAAMNITIGYLPNLEAELQVLQEGGQIAVAHAPQGGQVAFISARFGPFTG